MRSLGKSHANISVSCFLFLSLVSLLKHSPQSSQGFKMTSFFIERWGVPEQYLANNVCCQCLQMLD